MRTGAELDGLTRAAEAVRALADDHRRQSGRAEDVLRGLAAAAALPQSQQACSEAALVLSQSLRRAAEEASMSGDFVAEQRRQLEQADR